MNDVSWVMQPKKNVYSIPFGETQLERCFFSLFVVTPGGRGNCLSDNKPAAKTG